MARGLHFRALRFEPVMKMTADDVLPAIALRPHFLETTRAARRHPIILFPENSHRPGWTGFTQVFARGMQRRDPPRGLAAPGSAAAVWSSKLNAAAWFLHVVRGLAPREISRLYFSPTDEISAVLAPRFVWSIFVRRPGRQLGSASPPRPPTASADRACGPS